LLVLSQVNTVQLPRNGRRTLRLGDIVSFGGPANVRARGSGAPAACGGRNPPAAARAPET
jgi:hypothetical protein